VARAKASDHEALTADLKLQIEKPNRRPSWPAHGAAAELELTLEELETAATEDELAADMAAAKTTKVASFTLYAGRCGNQL
jgi:transposase